MDTKSVQGHAGQGQVIAKKALRATIAQTIEDDGSCSTSVMLYDGAGLPITTLSAWPPTVATPTETAADATPGPSAFLITPVTPPSPNTDGSFKIASVTCVKPVVAGSGQNVDFTVQIASGLTNQSAPQNVDAGNLSIIADPNDPESATVNVTEDPAQPA